MCFFENSACSGYTKKTKRAHAVMINVMPINATCAPCDLSEPDACAAIKHKHTHTHRGGEREKEETAVAVNVAKKS